MTKTGDADEDLLEPLLERWQLTDDEHTAVRRVPAGELLAIHARLRRLFPQNPELVYRWPTTPNKAWHRRPVDLLLERGVNGAREIRAYLERAAGR